MTIYLSPSNPGTIASGSLWNTTVTSTNGDTVQWCVFTKDFVARSGWLSLSGCTKGTNLSVLFQATGDYLQVRDPPGGTTAAYSYSGSVTIGAASTTPTAAVTVSLSPSSPGTIAANAAGGAPWSTVVTTTGVTSAEWAIFTSSGTARSAWNTLSGTGSGATLSLTFLASGDYVQVRQPGGGVVSYSGTVTIGSATVTASGTVTVSLSPSNPGTIALNGATAPWNTVITTTGVTGAEYAIFTATNSARSPWNLLGGTLTGAPLTVGFVATGDYLQVRQPGGGVTTYSSTVTVSTANAPWAATAAASSSAAAVISGGSSATSAADVAFAQAFAAKLIFGFNIERGWAWSMPGGVAACAAYLKAQGFSHVRLFFAWRPSVDMLGQGTGVPTYAEFKVIMDAAQAFITAGLPVILDCTDVLDLNADFGIAAANITTHITNCASWIAGYGFDPTMLCPGPVNEWADNHDYTQYQVLYHQILRTALPGFVISCGSNYWKDYSYLIAAPPFTPDGRTLWDFHCYEANSASTWTAVAASLKSWSKANGGIPVVWGETGLSYSGDSAAPSVWLTNLANMFPAMDAYHPTPWAITYGSGFPVNQSSSTIQLDDGTNGTVNLLGAFQAIATAIRAAAVASATATAALLSSTALASSASYASLTTSSGTISSGGGTVIVTAPGSGNTISFPVLPNLPGLYSDDGSIDTSDPIILADAVQQAQENFQMIAAWASAEIAAQAVILSLLVACQGSVTSAVAKLTAGLVPALPGPYANDAAAGAATPVVQVGKGYVDTSGIVRRRLS